MKILSKFAIGAVVVLAVAAFAPPADAACASAYIISSLEDGDNYSYIWTDGQWCGASACSAPAMTDGRNGFFWALGAGNPAIGAGADNGAVGHAYWLYASVTGGTYYPYYVLTSWAYSSDIDGCLTDGGDLGVAGTCTCLLLTDELAGVGKFALVSAQSAPGGQSFFNQTTGNAPIVLADMPKTTITGSNRDPGTFDMTFTVNVPALGSGVWEPATCECAGANATYKVFAQSVTRGNPPPEGRAVSAGWTELNQVGGAPQVGTALGSPVTVEALCGASDVDVYLAAQLTFDSGFTTDVVSANSTRVECGPNLADPQPIRPRIIPEKPELRAPKRTR